MKILAEHLDIKLMFYILNNDQNRAPHLIQRKKKKYKGILVLAMFLAKQVHKTNHYGNVYLLYTSVTIHKITNSHFSVCLFDFLQKLFIKIIYQLSNHTP